MKIPSETLLVRKETRTGRQGGSNESAVSNNPDSSNNSAISTVIMWSTSNSQDTQNSNDKKTFGLTSAISTAEPKAQDIQLTKELEEVIQQYGVIEPDLECYHRLEVLSRLNEIVREWIIEMSLARNMPTDMAQQVGGKVCTFGSYRLGVHSRGADIDALCVAPRHIERSDYFKSFYEKLKECPEVTELRTVEEAFVPVIKMNFSGIEIDLLFARLALRQVPKDVNLQNDQILKNLDPRCVRSLNGCRVTDEILNLVPNADAFRLALRAIKLWAKHHGIYSNALGYLGGVSWAMLVARTCQLYPTAVASTIVHKFFQVFSQWVWPNPVLLKSSKSPVNLDFPVWDPRVNASDRSHLMPIITPSYPQQNSTYNVSNSTRTIICKYLGEGFRIAEEIMMGRAKWPLLFEKPNFFAEYKHFILLVASSGSQKEHLEWSGLIEAKVRYLITILERNKFIRLVHANPEIFKLRDDYKPENEENDEQRPLSVWAIGIEFQKVQGCQIDLTVEIQAFTNNVMKHAIGIKMYKESMMVEAKYVKKKHLKNYLSEAVLHRDRPASEIMKDVPENNGATILLRKRTADEKPKAADAMNKNKLPIQNLYRKVNNKPNENKPDENDKLDENSKPDENNKSDDPTMVSPQAPTNEGLSSPENNNVTSSRQLPSPPESVFIDLCSSDAEPPRSVSPLVIDDDDDEDLKPPPIKRMRFTVDEPSSSPDGRNMSPDSSRIVPTPSPNEVICLSSDSESE